MKAIAVEPMEQMLITDAKGGEKIGEQGPHKIQGMGAGLVPKVSCDTAYVLYELQDTQLSFLVFH